MHRTSPTAGPAGARSELRDGRFAARRHLDDHLARQALALALRGDDTAGTARALVTAAGGSHAALVRALARVQRARADRTSLVAARAADALRVALCSTGRRHAAGPEPCAVVERAAPAPATHAT